MSVLLSVYTAIAIRTPAELAPASTTQILGTAAYSSAVAIPYERHGLVIQSGSDKIMFVLEKLKHKLKTAHSEIFIPEKIITLTFYKIEENHLNWRGQVEILPFTRTSLIIASTYVQYQILGIWGEDNGTERIY